MDQNGNATVPEVPAPVAEDSIRAVHRTFQEAMEAGDLSSALSLVDRDAVLVDRIITVDPSASRGEILLEVLRRYADGLRLVPLRTEVSVSEASSIVLTRYEVWDQVDGEAERVGHAVETLLLFRGPEGWRIQHLHRSPGDGLIEEPDARPR